MCNNTIKFYIFKAWSKNEIHNVLTSLEKNCYFLKTSKNVFPFSRNVSLVFCKRKSIFSRGENNHILPAWICISLSDEILLHRSYYYLVRIVLQHVSSIFLAWNKTISFPGHIARQQTRNCNYPLRRVSFSQPKTTIKFCSQLSFFTFTEKEITQVQVRAETIREYKNTYKQQSKYYCLYR